MFSQKKEVSKQHCPIQLNRTMQQSALCTTPKLHHAKVGNGIPVRVYIQARNSTPHISMRRCLVISMEGLEKKIMKNFDLVCNQSLSIYMDSDETEQSSDG